MVLFKADKRFKDLEKNVVHEAGEEFEMTIERSKELVANIKKNHDVDLVLTRVDKDDKEITNTKETKEGK